SPPKVGSAASARSGSVANARAPSEAASVAPTPSAAPVAPPVRRARRLMRGRSVRSARSVLCVCIVVVVRVALLRATVVLGEYGHYVRAGVIEGECDGSLVAGQQLGREIHQHDVVAAGLKLKGAARGNGEAAVDLAHGDVGPRGHG